MACATRWTPRSSDADAGCRSVDASAAIAPVHQNAEVVEGTAVLAYCRAGFEPETRADLARAAEAARIALNFSGEPQAGIVAATAAAFDADAWQRGLQGAAPIFARSVFAGHGPVPLPGIAQSGPRADRLTPLLAAIGDLAADAAHAPPWSSVWIEYPDTNEGKALASLARALEVRVAETLRNAAQLSASSDRRLHVLLTSGEVAYAWVPATPQREAAGRWGFRGWHGLRARLRARR